MFGLAWKLNSTLYWIIRRLREAVPDPVREDTTGGKDAAAAPSVNFQSC